MKNINLLHITDMHFGNEENLDYENSVDLKDNNIKKDFFDKLNLHWTQQFFQSVNGWMKKSNSKIDAIVCTGDLGFRGNSGSIADGASFLDLLCKNINLDKNNLIVCPGNHDLQQNKKGQEFYEFEKILKGEGIINYSAYENINKIVVNGIPIISVNSCLGGAEESTFFLTKYIDSVGKLSPEEKSELNAKFKKNGLDYLSDFLDIPAIGKKQKQNILDSINESKSDTLIILMHHNIFPVNSIELRPYSNIIDCGSIIETLIDTGKKIFVLHGHTHFEHNILAYYHANSENFISSSGCGRLDNTSSSSAKILEFYFSDENNHIITKVHSILKSGGAGYSEKFSHNIYEKSLTFAERKIMLEPLLQKKTFLLFDEIKSEFAANDDDLLKVILKDEYISLIIDKNGTSDYHKWKVSKKNI